MRRARPVPERSVSTGSRELTLRGLVLGALITVILTASNLYLGLKIGLTVASSIPAAVISMGVLRLLGRTSIGENNLVQTQASAAGTLSCVFASLPSIVMVGAWHGFPFWLTAGVSMAGGMTGVLFTIPLRRALVTGSALPYPEGVAAAQILKAGASEETGHLGDLLAGGAIAGLGTLFSGGFRLLAETVGVTVTAGHAVFRMTAGFSPALLGAGYLIGPRAGLAIGAGILIAWAIAVPVLTAIDPNPAHLAPVVLATGLWMHKVRFIGAGTIGIASIWTLVGLAGPVGHGLREAFASRGGSLRPEIDRDLSGRTILVGFLLLMLLLFALFAGFLASAGDWRPVVVAAFAGTLFCAVFGFLLAAACGVMAGIVGSSASPISGIAIVATILMASLLLGMRALGWLPDGTGAAGSRGAIAFCMFVTTAIIAAAAISNDNLQDLKTGQLVGATPWRQQTVLLVGCAVGALVIPPVLQLLYQAYGFVGAMPRAGMDPAQALAAPQPALLAAVASGIFAHSLDWTMISIGVALGVILVLLDIIVTRLQGTGFPVLAVGLGLYMPTTITIVLTVGGLFGWIVHRSVPGRDAARRQTGTMIASGLIVGESLMGILLAGIMAGSGRNDVLALVGSRFETAAIWLGLLFFVGTMLWFRRRVNALAVPGTGS